MYVCMYACMYVCMFEFVYDSSPTIVIRYYQLLSLVTVISY